MQGHGPLVGNDLVDLQRVSRRMEQLCARYVSRICTDAEHALLQQSPYPLRMLAALWSLKESAYKIERKCGAARSFQPKAYEVSPGLRIATQGCFEAQVQGPQGRMWGAVVLSNTCLHSYLSAGNDRVYSQVAPCPKGNDPSSEVRHLACQAIQAFFPGSAPWIEQDALGIPRVWGKTGRLPVDLSLSHHGRWVGSSFSIGPIAYKAAGD